MGSCCSTPTAANNISRNPRAGLGPDTSNNNIPQRKTLDLNRDLVWLSEAPINEAQVFADREAFWETAPVYGGKKVIWDTLKSALSADDPEFARLLISSANIIVPTMQLKDGCYDEQGEQYSIPNYCFSLPANVFRSKTQPQSQPQTDRNLEPSGNVIATPVVSASGIKTDIIVRPNTGKDLHFSLSETETLAQLKDEVLKCLNMNLESTSLKFIYRGKVIGDDTALVPYLKLGPGSIIQVLISSL